MRKNRVIKKVKSTFVVVVDGDCEVWYLKMLKRNERSIALNIKPEIPQKKKLSEQFQEVKNFSQDYSKVFWIIDFDNLEKETREAKKRNLTAIQMFLEYKKILNKEYKNVVIIVNNPCFEFWLILHFETTSKKFDTCESAEKHLKNHIKDYEKTQIFYTKPDNDIYLQLKPNLKTGLINAKKLGLFDSENTNRAMCEMQLFFEAEEFDSLFK